MLSEFRKRKFTAFFHHLDIDGDHAITAADFNRYAEVIKAKRGWRDDEPMLAQVVAATSAWWADMAKRFQTDRVSAAQWLEFNDALSEHIKTQGEPPQWAVDMCMGIHKVLDLNGNGTVCGDEYALWLEAIGSKANAAEVFKKLDLNQDGVVDISEMMLLFAQFLLSEDPADPGNYIMTGTF